MLASLIRSSTSLAVVIVAYLVYWGALVPFIEPSVQPKDPSEDGGSVVSHNAATQKWTHLFSAGSWELNKPKTLETEQGWLLIREYRTLESGRLELKPCTLIVRGKQKEDGDAKASRWVVLEAPEGAELQFSGELNLSRGKIGRLEGGLLTGPVIIRSPETHPGAGDALDLRTRDVQISRQQILAPHDVTFRYGRNYGSGRDLIVTLGGVSKKNGGANKRLGSEIGSVQSLELVHVDQIHLHLDRPTEITGQQHGEQQAAKNKASAEDVRLT